MNPNPVHDLFKAGQSVWIDYIRRDMLTSGELARLIGDGQISGLTSNPTIFEKAIAGARGYDAQLTELARAGKSAQEIFDAIAIQDIQGACDALRPVFDRTGGTDGFASIEVSPLLARSTAETLSEARRLWRAVARPNVMVKIPATAEGLPAIHAALSEGININITLIFSVKVYEQVIEAWLAGLEAFAAQGGDVSKVSSVASFFVSRVDTLVDPQLEALAKNGPPAVRGAAAALVGTVAVANARVAYGRFRDLVQGPRWDALAAKGAHVQRPLWASTGTKNKAYSDTKYVTELVASDTVNTMPPDTLKAFAEHGTLGELIPAKVEEAKQVLVRLAGVGISLEEACQKLERDGVRSFTESFHELIERVAARRAGLVLTGPARQQATLGALEPAFKSRLAALAQAKFAERLFARDATLWTSDPVVDGTIRNRLGWLGAPAAMLEERAALESWAAEIAREGYTDAVVLGMGGSSLCPDVFARTFPPVPGRLRLHVLDRTDPVGVARLRAAIDPSKTLFVVSTKSGNTTETLAFADYFEEEVRALGNAAPGRNFVAITDPNSPLESLALLKRYRRTFLNAPDVGGRYSALTYFGLVPAALAGIELAPMLESAIALLKACGPRALPEENPGLQLGALLGEAWRAGRDKLTLVVDPPLTALGAWLEQLVAESTGKLGKGVVPVDGEPLGAPDVYGADRVFVAIGLDGHPAADDVTRLAALAAAGHPVFRITLGGLPDLGAEFARWEVATAVCGAILGVNPFDEPNVSESKANTAAALSAFEAKGALTPSHALARGELWSLYAGGVHGSGLKPAAAEGGAGLLERVLGAHLATASRGDYVALLVFLAATPEEAKQLARVRIALRDRLALATTLGEGPRYLHSTGQLHKGGPATGVFLVLTAETREDVPIPGMPWSFGVLLDAQAQGDFEALVAKNRRALRIHLDGPRAAALARLAQAVEGATLTGRVAGAPAS
jgi:transaldolase/glucose-6-phosphate isomerase